MALGFQNIIRTTKAGKVTSVDYFAPRHIRIVFSKPTKRNKDQKSGSWAMYDDREGRRPVTVLTPRDAMAIFNSVAATVIRDRLYPKQARIEEISGPWRESYGQSA